MGPMAQGYLVDYPIPRTSPSQDGFRKRASSNVVASTLCSILRRPHCSSSAIDQISAPDIRSNLHLKDGKLALHYYNVGPLARAQKQKELENGASTELRSVPWTSQAPAADNTSLEDEPSRHVDYLSHDWREDDIWSSWRYVIRWRSKYSNGVRLENASWRTWAKTRGNLGTISPESLHWVKDRDTTWLYGPLKIPDNRATAISSTTSARLRIPNFSIRQRSILKRKSVVKLMFQRSESQQVLLPEAEHYFGQPLSRMCSTGLVQLHHRTRELTYPEIGSLAAPLSRGKVATKERRHVHFNDEVVQCIAIDAKHADVGLWAEFYNDEHCLYNSAAATGRTRIKKLLGSSNTSHETFSGRGKTINILPSTILQHCEEVPGPRIQPDFNELPTISVFSKLCRWLSFSAETS
ncbi:hypothetical protein N7481_010251 [Penicillium waksmanii]|uniref:uncharacterized protein n=1 Tax=Penicillium waksmanii TaxID=69791 RepID=UPI0025469FE5|nr:uncharacterized protein N7481_010251 [Penicillium waksmanii]KAJ5976544.1 hypothetical protein N7481_010251 [Penicillium waksmanii]